MLFQNKDGLCGVFAVANALLALKADIDVREIQMVSGGTPERGTSRGGIVRAIEYYEYKATVYEGHVEEFAWRWIIKWSAVSPVIVAIDNRQHWATCIGRFGNQIILVDPSVPDERFENNVRVLNKKEFLPMWIWGGRFLAIRVTRE